jgi:hypothetical protein
LIANQLGGIGVDNGDIGKIEKIISDRKEARAFYSKNSPVYRAFLELEGKAFSNGALEKNIKN